jgi:hypothetical protein
MRSNKVAVQSGLLSGVANNNGCKATPHAWYRGYYKHLNVFSVFTSGAVLRVPALAVRDEDFDVWPRDRATTDKDYIAWVNYLSRVYDIRTYDPEYRLVDGWEWRTKHPYDTKENALIRLRYAMDNAGSLDMDTVQMWLDNPAIAEFDLGLNYDDL